MQDTQKRTYEPRQKKIASRTAQIVAKIFLSGDLDDREISRLSVVDADARGGLQFVRIFVQLRAGQDAGDILARLDAVRPQIRFLLGKEMNQKYVPDLKFIIDDTLDRAIDLEQKIKEVL